MADIVNVLRKYLFQLFALILGVSLTIPSFADSSSPLEPPFDVIERQAEMGQPGRAFVCPAIPPAIISTKGQFYYTDKKGSIIDPKLLAKGNQLEAPIKTYTRRLGEIANAYIKSSPADAEITDCAWGWLQAWAQQGALTGQMDDQSELYRMWALTPIATSFLIAKGSHEPVPANIDINRIRSWIGVLSDKVLAWVARKKVHNNLSYWAASGVILASVVDQRRDYFDAAIALGERGVDNINAEGFLPGEMHRGHRAFEYHVFAMTPLSIVAETASKNGVDLFEHNNQGLRRLAERLLASKDDMSFFDQAAGVMQEIRPPLGAGQWIWAEIILDHYDMPDLEALVAPLRPLRFDRAGGDMTLLYGNLKRSFGPSRARN